MKVVCETESLHLGENPLYEDEGKRQAETQRHVGSHSHLLTSMLSPQCPTTRLRIVSEN